MLVMTIILVASWSMLGDMRKVYGYDDPQKLYPDVLNKNTVVKAQMAEWLFSVIYLLDRGFLPLMPSAISEKLKLKICRRRR